MMALFTAHCRPPPYRLGFCCLCLGLGGCCCILRFGRLMLPPGAVVADAAALLAAPLPLSLSLSLPLLLRLASLVAFLCARPRGLDAERLGDGVPALRHDDIRESKAQADSCGLRSTRAASTVGDGAVGDGAVGDGAVGDGAGGDGTGGDGVGGGGVIPVGALVGASVGVVGALVGALVGASVVANKPGADVRGRRSGGFGGDWRGRLDGATWWLCYCPGERKVSDHSACIQSKYESNTPDGAPYRVKQEGSATTMNSTKDSRQRGKLVRYCPGRKKEIQRRVRALKSKYEVNNGPGIHGARAPHPLR